MPYSYAKQLNYSFSDAVKKTKEMLAEYGFGIITEIDVKETLKKKLDIDYGDYLIIGACNPSLAYKALQAEKEIGLLLPCNVIVYQNNGHVFVSAIRPTVAMNMVDNIALAEIAASVEEKLKNVIDSV